MMVEVWNDPAKNSIEFRGRLDLGFMAKMDLTDAERAQMRKFKESGADFLDMAAFVVRRWQEAKEAKSAEKAA